MHYKGKPVYLWANFNFIREFFSNKCSFVDKGSSFITEEHILFTYNIVIYKARFVIAKILRISHNKVWKKALEKYQTEYNIWLDQRKAWERELVTKAVLLDGKIIQLYSIITEITKKMIDKDNIFLDTEWDGVYYGPLLKVEVLSND